MIHLPVTKAEQSSYQAVTMVEIVAMQSHEKASPTPWARLTTQQRNSTRRQAHILITEALAFWDSEARKEQPDE